MSLIKVIILNFIYLSTFRIPRKNFRHKLQNEIDRTDKIAQDIFSNILFMKMLSFTKINFLLNRFLKKIIKLIGKKNNNINNNFQIKCRS